MRPQRLGYDIGCYEAAAPSAVPLVDFAANPRAGAVPLTVQFADLSAGEPNAWEWDFGDGETSNERDPSHTYNTTGSFTVKLTAANVDGHAARTRSGYISVSTASPTDYFCLSATVEVGKLLKGAPERVRASDDSYLKIKAAKLEGKFSNVVNYVFRTNLASLSGLSVTSESRSSDAPVRQQFFLFNQSTGEWDLVDDNPDRADDDPARSALVLDPSSIPVSFRRGASEDSHRRSNRRQVEALIDLVKITATP